MDRLCPIREQMPVKISKRMTLYSEGSMNEGKMAGNNCINLQATRVYTASRGPNVVPGPHRALPLRLHVEQVVRIPALSAFQLLLYLDRHRDSFPLFETAYDV